MRIALSPAYYIFWRIDTSDNGPYLSFRMYEDYDKNNENLRERHSTTYNILVEKCKKIIENHKGKICFKWDEVKETRYGGNYKKSSLFTTPLGEHLKTWSTNNDILGESVRSFTKEFLKEMGA